MSFSNTCCSHIGFLSNITVTIPFEWNVLSAISISKILTWEVGEGPLYWYVVESMPMKNLLCGGDCLPWACVYISTTSVCGINGCPSLPNTENSEAECVYKTQKGQRVWKLIIKATGLWRLEVSLESESNIVAIYEGEGGSQTAGKSSNLRLIFDSHACSNMPKEASATLYEDKGYIQFDTILATSVPNLCERLRDQKYNRRIKKIKRWSKPALECDVKKAEEGGTQNCCNKLEEQDLCACECAGFMKDMLKGCAYTSLSNKILTWMTEYIVADPIVAVGQIVIRGQKLGYVGKPHSIPYLHWGVGDGQGGGNIGQTIEIDDVFNWPAKGERGVVPPPFPTILTPGEICYIKSTLIPPINTDCCLWEQLFDSPSHGDYEYYAQDLNCVSPPDEDLGMPVFVASGGCDVNSDVASVQNLGGGVWLVTITHEKKSPGGGVDDDFAPPLSTNMAQGFREIRSCERVQKKIHQVVSTGFAARPVGILHPIAKPLKVRGYNRPVPVTLKVSHNLKSLSSFQRVAEKIPEVVSLHYNATTNAWQYNQHFLVADSQWSLMFSLSNQGETWALHMTIGKNLNGKNASTKLRAGLQRVPSDGFVLTAEYASGSLSSNCTVHYKSCSDELKLLGSEPLLLKVSEK